VSELNLTLSKELPMAKRHMKKCSPFLAIKEMQIKTTLKFHLTPVRITIISTPPPTGVGEGVKKKERLYSAGGHVNKYNHSGKKNWRLLKNLNIDLPFDPAIPLLGLYPKEWDTHYSRGSCTPMFIAALFTIAKYGNNHDAPLLTNGLRKCGICTQWNFRQA
jgi:hypothetical protein